jgi:hypothetical protein
MFLSLQIQSKTAPFTDTSQRVSFKRRVPGLMAWTCILLAWMGASWFAFQCFLVPQPQRFAAPWQNSQWVQPADGYAPVAYFRFTTSVEALPDAAFVAIAANQSFRLYVNGIFIASNALPIVKGSGVRAYIYDVASALQKGSNVIAVRVANLDQQMPELCAVLGIVRNSVISYYGTGPDWQATTHSDLVYPRYSSSEPLPSWISASQTGIPSWLKSTFDASAWLPAQEVANPPASPPLSENPQLFEHAYATQWMSVGAGHDGYFVRTLSLPATTTGTWIRIAAAGPATIFIDGKMLIVWNGEAPVPPQHIASFLSDQETIVQYQQGLLAGLYDISPYLHPGTNTIAVHVTSPGIAASQAGLSTYNASLSLDILVGDAAGHYNWLASGAGWQAASQASPGWNQGGAATQKWAPPLAIGRPGAIHAIYVAENPTSHNLTLLPLSSLGGILMLSGEVILGFWLLMSLVMYRCYSCSPVEALETMSVAYMPALSVEALLVVLSYEPQIPQPFPYTWQWGVVLLALAVAGNLLLWLCPLAPRKLISLSAQWGAAVVGTVNRRRSFVFAWLREHWGLIVIVLIAIPLISYNLSYEPYWQDELTSYYAAKGVLAHGLPLLPSGFLYAKGELYSYVLALSMKILGEQNGAMRVPSVLEYLVSLPLLYGVGCYLFNRRIALLATAMLALSPYAMIWGRQMRMYEQAQMLTILVIYLFYRASRQPYRPGLIYLAVASLVVTYFSHEEIFIILPALVICVLLISAMESRSQIPAGRGISRFLPPVVYQKHWWIAAVLGAILIGAQLVITKVTHPPILGTDQSQQPLIQMSATNIAFYVKLLFFPSAVSPSQPSITVDSLLAVAGCIWAIRRKDAPAIYCALLLVISLITLGGLFTLTADRYVYPLLPALYLMGAYAVYMGLYTFKQYALSAFPAESIASPYRGPSAAINLPAGQSWRLQNQVSYPLAIHLMLLFCTALLCASVLISPMLPISGYNLFLDRELGFTTHRHFPDYDAVGQYMQSHWQKGDIVIAVSPAISILYYVGHVDYFFSINRALYLFEKDGRITDTPTGSTPLLDQRDFEAVLAANKRIWIISDNGEYQAGVTKDGRFTFPSDFHLVFEGYGSAIYFRGG